MLSFAAHDRKNSKGCTTVAADEITLYRFRQSAWTMHEYCLEVVSAEGIESIRKRQTKHLTEHSWQTKAMEVHHEQGTNFRNQSPFSQNALGHYGTLRERLLHCELARTDEWTQTGHADMRNGSRPLIRNGRRSNGFESSTLPCQSSSIQSPQQLASPPRTAQNLASTCKTRVQRFEEWIGKQGYSPL